MLQLTAKCQCPFNHVPPEVKPENIWGVWILGRFSIGFGHIFMHFYSLLTWKDSFGGLNVEPPQIRPRLPQFRWAKAHLVCITYWGVNINCLISLSVQSHFQATTKYKIKKLFCVARAGQRCSGQPAELQLRPGFKSRLEHKFCPISLPPSTQLPLVVMVMGRCAIIVHLTTAEILWLFEKQGSPSRNCTSNILLAQFYLCQHACVGGANVRPMFPHGTMAAT